MTPLEPREEKLGERLRAVGFYACANDWERGRLGIDVIIRYLRRDAPRVTEPCCSQRLALADDLERDGHA